MKIYVKVKPNSKGDLIKEISKNNFEVNVKSPAKCGKANLKVTKLISKRLGVLEKNVIIKNPTSRKKIIEIR